MKTRKQYPREGFKSIEDAREWVLSFMDCYNNEHRHSGVVHLVLENCADVFHSFAKRYISESGEYIDAHVELDHEHSELGKELYDNLTEEQFVRMARLCEHCWHMLKLLLNRVAVLTLQDIGAKGRSKDLAMT
ncbi:hypothetical protein [Thorsellia kenyensis]|uniref:Integrase catalytic domain-containing protein n=1 Tax=Thorsellia kenyensis TaxID=1549888 RepID=A0ABV6C857_9GAMM